MILAMRLAQKVPSAILALFIGTATAFFFHLPVETIGSRFGGIPAGLPHFQLTQFRPDLVLSLLSPVLTVTLLGAIESLLSAVVSDRMSGDKHNPNVELFAQGVANFVSPLFGGLPATGAIARTATNIRSGARTPVAGMIHALTLLLILMVGTSLASHIPLCVLAAILFIVAYNMGEWSEIPDILKLTKADISVWLITFALTVFADLTVAVEAGMILACLLFIRKVTLTTTVERVTPEFIQDGIEHSMRTNEIPDGVAVFRIQGPFLFGASDKLEVIYDQLDELPPIVMLGLRNMTALDATGLHALIDLTNRLRATGRYLVMSGPKPQPRKLLEQAELELHLGKDNIHETLGGALSRIRQIQSGANTEV
jgi:SulP family sulfate permease